MVQPGLVNSTSNSNPSSINKGFSNHERDLNVWNSMNFMVSGNVQTFIWFNVHDDWGDGSAELTFDGDVGDLEIFKSIKKTYKYVDPPIDFQVDKHMSKSSTSWRPVSLFSVVGSTF